MEDKHADSTDQWYEFVEVTGNNDKDCPKEINANCQFRI